MACGPQGPGDTGGRDGEFPCSLGIVDLEEGYRDMADGERLELVLGFQGFLFVRTWLHTPVEPGAHCEGIASLEIDGLDPMQTTIPLIPFSAQDDGWRSDEMPLFLASDSVGTYANKEATLAFRLQDGKDACVLQQPVILVDDDPCIHTDGDPVCPDDDTGMP